MKPLKNPLPKIKLTVLFSLLLIFISCRESGKHGEKKESSASASADTVKEIPPPDFISTVAGINDKNLDMFIHPVKGFWYLKAGWFHPYFIRLRDLPILTKQENLKFSKIVKEELPKVDCSLPSPYWTKNGCYASEENNFYKDKVWYNCELSNDDEASVEEMAKSIRWTVINSREGKYYFSLINGKWYLTFVDLRVQCEKSN